MNVFRFQVADYKRISQFLFAMVITAIPLVLITFYFLSSYSAFPYVLSAIFILMLIIAVYMSLLKYFLIYDSEFTLSNEGILEKNLKNNKEVFFKWEDVELFKFGSTKHTNEDKEYLKMSFNSSKHTISVAEFKSDEGKMKLFANFRDTIESFLLKHNPRALPNKLI
ncbi:MAG: hypothetical protein KIT33_05660 [Candidatus Kapabacteria bacterium]|nr:hypothetical protein [Ignavibacteriota bacterium]MCW5884443.1 hypothetical protein [Candidatus Kapabacteria bacterium]